MNTLPNLYKYLVAQRHLGTFLKFEIDMNGKPTAIYSHGRIEFDDMEDLARYAETAAADPEQLNEAALRSRQERKAFPWM